MKTFISILALAAISSQCVAQTYSEIVAFGASLTDGGNVFIASPLIVGYAHPPSPPNFEGRLSNGPIWVDFLADQIGVDRPVASLGGGHNYAYGGATTGAVPNLFGVVDMDAQVATYLNDNRPSGDELFVVSGVTSLNDFSKSQQPPADTALAARKIGQAVDDLAAAGARNILLSLAMTTPRFSNSIFTDKVAAFNDALRDELKAVRKASPGSLILEFDPQPTVDAFLADPSSIGVRFVEGQACNDCQLGNPNPVDIASKPNDYLYWDGLHFTTPANEAIAEAAFETLPIRYLINENFDDLPSGQVPEGTSLLDSNIGQPWGPSIITAVDGAIRFQTTGDVPPHDPPERPFETGFMAVTWDDSAEDPRYWDGYLEATLRADTPGDANLLLRSDLEQLKGYLFSGLGARGKFYAYRVDGSGSPPLGEIADPAFEIGTDYHMEVGAVGNRISMKVWAVGDEEPELPQLVVYDDGLSKGAVGFIPASSPTLFTDPTKVDVTYDDFKFQPSVLGDINQNTILDAADIDRLSLAISNQETNLFFDFNQDRQVNALDRQAWVEMLAGTAFGDADLNGKVEFADFLVLSENFGESGGWAQGDFDGNGEVDFPDFLGLSANFGQSSAVAGASVPEPCSIVLLLFGVIAIDRFIRFAC